MNLVVGMILPAAIGWVVARRIVKRGEGNRAVVVGFVVGGLLGWIVPGAFGYLATLALSTFGSEALGQALTTGIKVAFTMSLISAVGSRKGL